MCSPPRSLDDSARVWIGTKLNGMPRMRLSHDSSEPRGATESLPETRRGSHAGLWNAFVEWAAATPLHHAPATPSQTLGTSSLLSPGEGSVQSRCCTHALHVPKRAAVTETALHSRMLDRARGLFFFPTFSVGQKVNSAPLNGCVLEAFRNCNATRQMHG